MSKATAEKKRANGHRSRKGTNGKPPSPKHNDRNFDLSKAEHIDERLIQQNEVIKLIDLQKILPSEMINPNATFDEYEHQVYEVFFARALEQRNEKAIKARHKDRVQDIDEFRKNAKFCPEESIWTIGNRDNKISPEVLKECFGEFIEWHTKEFPNVLLLDAALHCDEPEAAPHIHLRQVWYHSAADKDGNTYFEISQKNALKEMGIERPETDKKESRYNNAKVTYTALLRQKWLDIAESKGIDIEREPQDKSRSGLPLDQLKKRTLEEQIADLERDVATLDSQIEEKQELLPQLRKSEKDLADKVAELERLEQQIRQKQTDLADIDEEIERSGELARMAYRENQTAKSKLADTQEKCKQAESELADIQERKRQAVLNAVEPTPYPQEKPLLEYPPEPKEPIYSNKEYWKDYKAQCKEYKKECSEIGKENAKITAENAEIRRQQAEWRQTQGLLQIMKEEQERLDRQRKQQEQVETELREQQERLSEREKKLDEEVVKRCDERLAKAERFAELTAISENWKQRYEKIFGEPYNERIDENDSKSTKTEQDLHTRTKKEQYTR